MKVTDFFERTYVINLPERSDRRKIMTQELEKAGMPLAPKQVEIFSALRPDSAEGFPSIGVRGCFLSHFSILKQAKADGLANVMVMEDDLVISDQFRANQSALITQLEQTNWGFVYFGHVQTLTAGTSANLQPFSGPLVTAHFYGINGQIFDQLIEFLEEVQRRPPGHPDGGPMHLDGAYSTFRAQNPDIPTLIANPNMGWQRSSRSDISPNAWYDRLPVVKQLTGIARTGKGWLKAQRST